MGQLRRGFKTEANEIAASMRQELGIDEFRRLDPRRLAEHLDIEVVPLSTLVAEAWEIACLLEANDRSLSALTVFRGSKRCIGVNDAHDPGRQNAAVAHELAHGLLLHQPGPAFNAAGCRNWNQEMEDEADCLGGKLLLPDAAARRLVYRNVSNDAAQKYYGVSPELLRWRINMSGGQRIRQSRTR